MRNVRSVLTYLYDCFGPTEGFWNLTGDCCSRNTLRNIAWVERQARALHVHIYRLSVLAHTWEYML